MGPDPIATTITDDRGIPCPLFEPQVVDAVEQQPPSLRSRLGAWLVVSAILFAAEFQDPPVTASELGQSALIVLALAIAFTSTRAALLIVAAAILYFEFVLNVKFGHWILSVILATIALAFALSPKAVLNSDIGFPINRSARLERRRRQLIGRCRCASCGRDLSDTVPEADGRTPCPKCGAAWKLAHPDQDKSPDSCPRCGYCLAGLPVVVGESVRCPECGLFVPERPIPLADEETPAIKPTPVTGPHCWGCRRPLRGLPLMYGDRIQCPNCGQWRSGLTAADVAPPPGP